MAEVEERKLFKMYQRSRFNLADVLIHHTSPNCQIEERVIWLKFKPQHATALAARCRVFCGGNSCLGNQVSLRHSESRGVDSEDALRCTRRERSLDRDKWNNHTQSGCF